MVNFQKWKTDEWVPRTGHLGMGGGQAGAGHGYKSATVGNSQMRNMQN